MPSSHPDSAALHPLAEHPRVVFLKPLVDRPNIEAGEFSYYDDPDAPERFFERNVLYHYPFIGDRLVIGRFVAIATGVTFIMNGANHAMTGFSTFPFGIFGHGWEKHFDMATITAGLKGDTIVGSDVWLGREATILPGVTIGAGAIVAAKAVVSRDVPPYAVVAGNPARIVKMRFPAATIARLLAIGWWDWPVAALSRHLPAILGHDIDALEAAAADVRQEAT